MRQKSLLKAFVSFVILVLSMSSMAFAQSQDGPKTVTGRVFDEKGEPLPGAYVLIAGTQTGTTTDADGRFSLTAKASDMLEIQFLGYGTLTVPVQDKPMKLEMVPDKTLYLEEAVTIAYGSVQKQDLTGSVSNVKMSDIKNVPVLSVDQALQGRIAGADIMSTTGEPGATTSIRIRGTRSIIASNEPLIVVDGVMDAVADLNDINSADIESITVLKDASSTAIYGSRGSNGVILITTRKGDTGSSKPKITFKAEAGFSQLPSKLDLMDATQYAQYRNDMALFTSLYGDISEGQPLSDYPYKDPLSLGKGTDWIGEITRTAPTQNYSLSVGGGSKKSSWYASFGYNDTQGIIRNSGMKRYTARLNLDHQLFKWMKIGYQGSYAYRDQDRNLAAIGGTSIRNAAIYLNPLLKVTDYVNPDYEDAATYNPPTATIALNTYNVRKASTTHSMYVEFKLAKGLKLRSQNSFYDTQSHTFRYYPSTLPAKNEGEGGEAYRAETEAMTLSTENTINWKYSHKGHSLDLLGGYTAYRYVSNSLSVSGSGYMDDKVKWNDMSGVIDKNTLSPSTGYSQVTKMSVLARLDYNYGKRYYLTVTGRYDGASNFAANNKWGFFPSAALKWNIKNEKFMKHVDWIDEFALRLSAGRTGNDAVSAYRSLEKLTSVTNGYLFDGAQQASYYRQSLPSPDLTWEKTDLYNVALDLSFFNNRLAVTAEGYISKTKDLLMEVQVASQSGFSSKFTNLGNTTNKGLEFTIESRNIVKRNFTWTTNLTISCNRQMVNDIGTSEFVATASSAGNNPYMMHGFVKGYPLNAVWGFKYAGVWHSVDEFVRNESTHAYVSESTITQANYGSSLGLPKYYDINNDGALDQKDLVYLGNADPDLYGGFQNTFSIYGLNIGIYLSYSLGGKIYNYSELYMAGGNRTNQYSYMVNRWHPTRNPDSDLPRAGGTQSCSIPSDRMVYDASYLRLKSVSIGYTFDLSKKVKWLRDITLTASGENLWLWKKYNGFDPDVSSSGDSSTLRRLDLGAYPKARTVVFSLQIRY
ncbi:MAG: SusC/RagA family TonB-linked outer membrane protein [Candidatus Cryptobacteroides sp.]